MSLYFFGDMGEIYDYDDYYFPSGFLSTGDYVASIVS